MSCVVKVRYGLFEVLGVWNLMCLVFGFDFVIGMWIVVDWLLVE